MHIRFGYELVYRCAQPTPMILMLHTHTSRVADLVVADRLTTSPRVPLKMYRDGPGNLCTRLTAPAGNIRITSDAVIEDSGLPEPAFPKAREHPIEQLPEETLVYLLGSRYCDTEALMDPAWELFGTLEPGSTRVQAICDYVHTHVKFGYAHARQTRTALDAFNEQRGVCRDFAHLAIAFCRCLNIPARYCTGYLGDIGVPASDSPMDFAGWFEAYLGGAWHTFDPRNNARRIGRVLVARGRDAADVAISTTFGSNRLEVFKVWSEQIDHVSARIDPLRLKTA